MAGHAVTSHAGRAAEARTQRLIHHWDRVLSSLLQQIIKLWTSQTTGNRHDAFLELIFMHTHVRIYVTLLLGNAMFRKKIVTALCLLSVALISACGGGGAEGGSVAVTPPVVPPVTTPVTPVTPAPAWIAAIKSQSNQNLTLQVAGFGSSVGAGAALVDAAQAPVSYFASQLPKAFASANVKAVADNRSVNGSIISQFLSDVPKGNWETYVSTGKKANVVLLAYGMNDGFPAIYNAAQPPHFFLSQLLAVVKLIKDSGAEPIIMTSPHPLSTAGWSMPPGIDQTYPSLVKAPVAPESMIPSASTSVLMQDPLGTGVLIPVSQRHLEINKLMRQAATESGASLIDVEKYWFEAVAAKGEKALYGAGETVHPNLLGHQLSYQKAIDDFLAKSAQFLK